MGSHDELLDRVIAYAGAELSVRSLEDTISRERDLQNDRLSELNSLHNRNNELQVQLSEEMTRLKEISDTMGKQRSKGFWSFLPWVRDRGPSRQSVEDLLRRQYEMSALRLKEAAEFADRLEGAKSDLYDEIDRLNERIVQSAKNEELASDYVFELRELKTTLERELLDAIGSSANEREIQRDLDRVRRRLAEHTTRLKLYSSAEERLAALRRNTRQLAETIGHLQADITRYVTAASEKMDLVSGQIQAIGAAADASMVMIELKQSLDALTDSINHTTRFVAETQQYFRSNVDSMIDDLELYDEETEKVLQESIARNEILDEIELEESLSSALAKKIDALAEEVELDFQEAEQTVAAKATESP